MTRTIKLRISKAMQHEYEARCPTHLHNVFTGQNSDSTFWVTADEAKQLREDAVYFYDPDGPDEMTNGERKAYKALVEQIDTALA